MLTYNAFKTIRQRSLPINKPIYLFLSSQQGFNQIFRFSQLAKTTEKTEDQNVFKVPKEAQIAERKRYRFSYTSLNGFSVVPYGRREPIKDAEMLEKAMQKAVLRSTGGKNDGSKPLILSQDLKLKLRVNIRQKMHLWLILQDSANV
ncbi:unnamed protein product, partial [Pneumocystis jirovecii]